MPHLYDPPSFSYSPPQNSLALSFLSILHSKIRRTSELKPFHTNLGSRAASKFLNSRKTEEERREAEEEEAGACETRDVNSTSFLFCLCRKAQLEQLDLFDSFSFSFYHFFLLCCSPSSYPHLVLETQRRIRQTPYLKRFSLNIADFKHLFDHMKRIMDSVCGCSIDSSV